MALKEEEFERLHNELVELKTSNYTFQEDLRRRDHEILCLKTRIEELDKELAKSQQLAKLNPLSFAKQLANKKAESKEQQLIEQLTSDNDRLMKKIEQSEEEFKLTNETLRNEVSSLISENNVLNRELNEIKGLPADHGRDRTHSAPFPMADVAGDIGQATNDSSNQRQLSYAFLVEKETLTNRLTEVTAQLNMKQTEIEQLKARCEELAGFETQLADLNLLNAETQNLAEKRKQLIDEMKIALDEQNGDSIEKLKFQHQKEIDELTKSRDDKINKLEALVTELRSENATLKKNTQELSLLKDKLANNEEEIAAKNERILELDDRLKTVIDDSEKRLFTLEDDKEKSIILLNETHECEIKELKRQLDERNEKLAELEKEVIKHQTEIKDSLEERKIQEKKGMMMVKEVRRQAHQEKRRADKLQERLNQLLAEKPVDLNSSNGSKVTLNDASSVGSWSYVNKSETKKSSGSIISDAALDDQCINSPCPSSPNISSSDLIHNNYHQHNNSTVSNGSILEEENATLLQKLAQLQQEKWSQEEKINSLELAVAKLRTETQSKSQIIEFYCMDTGRSEPHSSPSHHVNDKLTVKRVVDFIKDRGDENAKEINRKLQRMLEETLTKNMHLQRDLEALSNELHRLTKQQEN